MTYVVVFHDFPHVFLSVLQCQRINKNATCNSQKSSLLPIRQVLNNSSCHFTSCHLLMGRCPSSPKRPHDLKKNSSAKVYIKCTLAGIKSYNYHNRKCALQHVLTGITGNKLNKYRFRPSSHMPESMAQGIFTPTLVPV